MARLNMMVDDWVTTLSHSYLPTVIVEGKDDVQIYRWMEKHIDIQNADVLSVGGRNNLLSLYERRKEFAHLPVAFVADRDLWLFSGIPSDYPDIIWTQGYSIENDLYAGADLESLLDAGETEEHQQVLDIIIEWFAFEVEEYLAEREARVDTHCNRVVPPGKTEMDQDFCTRRGFRPPNEELHQQVKDEYQLQLRGKSLFEILVRFLNTPDHGRFDDVALREIAVKMADSHELMDRLIGEIERTITEHTPPNYISLNHDKQ